MPLTRMMFLAGLCAFAAWAQSFNIDANASTGAGAGVPSSAFGGAAGQPGFWNALATGGTTVAVPLFDLAGAPTAVTVQRSASVGAYAFDNSSTTGETEKLMDDIDDPSPGPVTYTFAGLVPGEYRVYTYAWAPDDATFRTNVSVPGSTSPAQVVGGGMASPNLLTLGITHAIHDVVTSTGSIGVAVHTAISGGSSSINGFQLVRCPVGFGVQLSQPFGIGTDLNIAFTCGSAANQYALGVSVVQGAFPNGPFFGIEYDPGLISFVISYGPPLYGTLDSNGNAFGSVPGPLPPGLPIYAVAITANPSLTMISAAAPCAYTLQ